MKIFKVKWFGFKPLLKPNSFLQYEYNILDHKENPRLGVLRLRLLDKKKHRHRFMVVLLSEGAKKLLQNAKNTKINEDLGLLVSERNGKKKLKLIALGENKTRAVAGIILAYNIHGKPENIEVVHTVGFGKVTAYLIVIPPNTSICFETDEKTKCIKNIDGEVKEVVEQ